MIGGREIGAFDVMYEPERFEPVTVGRMSALSEADSPFQVWTSFRPRRACRSLSP